MQLNAFRKQLKRNKIIKSTINYRKKFSPGVHTQEVTDSSDEVLAKRPVSTYAKNHAVGQNLSAVRRVQRQLISDYEQDFSKHALTAVIPRIRMVWDGIPSQLAKENKKFIYSVLREGWRAKDFELAIQWLVDCGLCHKVGRVIKGGIPLKAYRDIPAFKLWDNPKNCVNLHSGVE